MTLTIDGAHTVAMRLAQTTSADEAFGLALPVILDLEGGYANDPQDPGGATMHGITQRVYDTYRRLHDLPRLPVLRIADAEVQDIYRSNYWVDGSCNRVALSHPRLALAHFDAAVNCGTHQAALFLQRTVGATDDGVIGPVTIARVQIAPEGPAIARYLELRAEFYHALVGQRPQLGKFLDAWMDRLRWIARATDTPIAPAFAKPDSTPAHA